MSSDSSRVTDEPWEEFHRVVNMTSRELRDWLIVRDADELTEALPDRAGSDRGRAVLATAGQAAWRHQLMSIGHDPLKPAD
ncbi:DUF3140 domain-containing protein [Knoellia sp. CPCC 206435]|uniref:DUF3140 domain-containing protein n=1 Tax=Knoellia terrae TaxID=3404797 RepID=UPI003B429F5F